MQAEKFLRQNFSTGGNALPYPPAMRTTLQILTLFLLTSIPACGDDAEPTRPADGTVKMWESCLWDGQLVPELCEADLSCSSHGVCSSTCETLDSCPVLDGFTIECSSQAVDPEASICVPLCNSTNECPKTGGVELSCLNFYCIGDPQ